jgi:hypothetical protein
MADNSGSSDYGLERTTVLGFLWGEAKNGENAVGNITGYISEL